LEAVPNCVPIADGGEDGHAPDAQLEIHLHDFSNRQFKR
jgi:hypothetical protein